MAKRLNNPDFKPIEFEGVKKRADMADDAFNRLRSQIVTSNYNTNAAENIRKVKPL